MVPYGRSSMTSEKLRFTYRIEKFSIQACKKFFASPEFESSDSSKWCLFIDLVDDNLVVRLNRNEDNNRNNKLEDRLVRAKVFIVDFHDNPCLTEETDIFFTRYTAARDVLSVSKSYLNRYCGLYNLWYLPEDTLTVGCELVIYKESQQPFRNDKKWNDRSQREDASSDKVTEFFACSSLRGKRFHFRWTFDDFPLLTRKERLTTDNFRPEKDEDGDFYTSSDWGLVLYDCNNDLIDVKIRRNDPFGYGQFAKVTLRILGRYGLPCCSLSGEIQAFFHGYADEEVRVLTIEKQYLRGLNKFLLLPGDALTLHCDVCVYDENTSTFFRKQDFLRNFEKQRELFFIFWCRVGLIVLFLFPLCLTVAYFAVLALFNEYIFPFLTKALSFAVLVYIISCLLLYIREKAEEQTEAKMSHKNKKRNSMDKNNSYEDQNARHCGKQSSRSHKETKKFYNKKKRNNYCNS